MSKYQTRWSSLMESVAVNRLSNNNIGSLYRALTDADAVIDAARWFAKARTQGDIAAVKEECGDAPERSSESWYEEAEEAERTMIAALEKLDIANDRGYS